jgi:acetolactate synthase-1/2/3 large subunit
VVAAPLPPPPATHADAGVVEAVARVLRSGEPVTFIMSGLALRAAPLATAGGICAATGARMMAQTSNNRIERGAGRTPIERVPYPVDLALKALAGTKHLVLVNAVAPVGFFAYPGKPGRMYPDDCTVHVLARPEQDGPAALAHLADLLGAEPAAAPPAERPALARGAVEAEAFSRSLAALMPEGAIVVDEAVTFGRGLFPITRGAAPHDWIQLTGGAIGDGLPLSTGAAVGAPGRRVITLQADGSAMYTVQALWTQAREKLDVTTIIFSNRKYAILLGELANVGANPGRTALDMMDLGNPDIDWCRISQGMGVEAARAETMEQFNDLLAASAGRSGPFLIELMT